MVLSSDPLAQVNLRTLRLVSFLMGQLCSPEKLTQEQLELVGELAEMGTHLCGQFVEDL